ncbi:MAG: hypothetical protein P8J87_03055 [Verrucomicrobiales bacterium]|nr:hypothetical protein [Verrucomicrobiales bacterium]
MHKIVKSFGISIIYGFSTVVAVFGHETETTLPFKRPHAHEAIESHAHLGWESSYLSEGRDSLDGDSLLVGSFEMAWQHLAGGIWYGYSPDQRYDELQITIGLTQSLGEFEFYGGYTHLRFPFADLHDNELGAGVAWSGLPLDIGLSADIYYSFDADGYFAEISAAREFEITDQLSFNFSSPLGINQGYVPDGHDGANHFALRFGLEFALTKSVSVTAHATQSWALDRNAAFPGDEQLIDFFHSGVGFQWKF